MKKFLLAGAFAALASFNTFGAASCASGPQPFPAWSGSTHCTVTNGSNSWDLSNFIVASQSAFGFTSLPSAASLNVEIQTVGSNGFSVTYSYSGNGENFFTVSGTQDVVWLNGLWVTGTPIVGIDNTVLVASGNTFTNVKKEIQSQGGVDLHDALGVVRTSAGSTTLSTTNAFSNGTLSINDRINFNGSNQVSPGVVTSYTNTFYAAASSEQIPEPMTFILMGAGLVGIAAFRRRKV